MFVLTFFERYTYPKAIAFSFVTAVLLIPAFLGGQALFGKGVTFGLWLLSVKFVMAFGFGLMLYKANVLGVLNNWSFNKRQLLVIALPFLAILLPAFLVNGWSIREGRPIFIVLLSNQSTGFLEELQFRAVLLLAMFYVYLKSGDEKCIVKVVLVTAVGFGVMHSMNILAGMPLSHVLYQVTFTTAMGIAYAIFVVITRNIWIIAVYHGLSNSLDPDGAFPFIPEEHNTLILSITLAILMFALYEPQDARTIFAKLKSRVKI